MSWEGMHDNTPNNIREFALKVTITPEGKIKIILYFFHIVGCFFLFIFI
jgi:hypothetical protein